MSIAPTAVRPGKADREGARDAPHRQRRTVRCLTLTTSFRRPLASPQFHIHEYILLMQAAVVAVAAEPAVEAAAAAPAVEAAPAPARGAFGCEGAKRGRGPFEGRCGRLS
jgi:hypothetical protein